MPIGPTALSRFFFQYKPPDAAPDPAVGGALVLGRLLLSEAVPGLADGGRALVPPPPPPRPPPPPLIFVVRLVDVWSVKDEPGGPGALMLLDPDVRGEICWEDESALLMLRANCMLGRLPCCEQRSQLPVEAGIIKGPGADAAAEEVHEPSEASSTAAAGEPVNRDISSSRNSCWEEEKQMLLSVRKLRGS